jgi:uncharacterized membrane protein YhaH (DUF805 family)
MYNGLVHLHNFLRWVVLILLIVAIVRHLMGMTGKKAYSSGDRKTDLFLMISAHIQLTLGLVLWFMSDLGLKLIRSTEDFGSLMKDAVARFWTMEHFIGMVIAVVLITVGRGATKKNIADASKHSKAFWFYLIALILILLLIPWPGKEVARPLFPGMG